MIVFIIINTITFLLNSHGPFRSAHGVVAATSASQAERHQLDLVLPTSDFLPATFAHSDLWEALRKGRPTLSCRLGMPSHPGPAVGGCRPTLALPFEDAVPPRPCRLRMPSHPGFAVQGCRPTLALLFEDSVPPWP